MNVVDATTVLDIISSCVVNIPFKLAWWVPILATVLATLSMPQNITVACVTIVTYGNFEGLKYFVDGNLEKILLSRFTCS